jgi:hypothetical protein
MPREERGLNISDDETINFTIPDGGFPMKRTVVFAAALLLSFGIGTSHALPGISIDAGISVPAPTGDFADAAKTGIGAEAEAFAGLPMLPFKVGCRAAYSRFGHDVGGGNTQITEILPSIRYELGLPLGIFSLFGQFGAGYYHWKSTAKIGGVDFTDDGKEFGISAGVGASAMNVMIMPMYHRMFDNAKTSYISLDVGMRF